MDPVSAALFLAGAFAAEVIGTMAGFGAATVLTPIAGLFMDIKAAVAIVTCFHLCGNLSRLYFFGRHTNWRLVLQFGVTGVLCSLLGAQATVFLPPEWIRVALGAFLLLYVALDALGATAARVPATPGTLLAGGAGSGFVAGLIGTGGAIRSVCLLAFGLPKEAYLGTSAMLALLVDGTRLPVYLSQGLLPKALWGVMLALVGIAFLGAWTGQYLVRRVSPAALKRFVMAMLLIMGVKLIADGWRGLA